MNTERRSRELGLLVELGKPTHYLDGSEPLKEGIFVDDKGRKINYLQSGRDILYRTNDNKAIIFFSNGLEAGKKVVSVLTWSDFSVSGEGETVFEAGSEGISQPLVTYDPSSGELSFTNNEDWIRVGGQPIEGYYSKDYWISQGPGWQRFGPTIIKIETSPLTVSLRVELKLKKPKDDDEGLLNSLLKDFNFEKLKALMRYAEEDKDLELLATFSQAPSLLTTYIYEVVFTTRLPTKPLIQQIVAPEIPPLTARTLAQDFTPKLREATAKEKEIFGNLLRSS